MTGKRLRKIIWQLLLTLCILKKKKCVEFISKINSNCEKRIILLIIPKKKVGIILQ